MMKIAYPVCCGADIHKNSIIATIVTTDKCGVSQYQQKTFSTTIILAETGVDMSVFESDKHLCSWCGLAPANNESAVKKKSVRISKAGNYLKPMMVQCALAAIKSKKEPYFANNMIPERKPFYPTDYMKMVEPCSVPSKVVLNDENVFAYFEAQDCYDISLMDKRNK